MSVEAIQLQIMVSLLAKGLQTRYGKQYNFSEIHSYNDFSNKIPIGFYKDLESDIQDLKSGKENILWPGKIDKFAVSSGTTGEGKHLPLSTERLKSDRIFMQKVAGSYLNQRPNIFKLWGKHLSLPGSFEKKGNILIGEISGFSALRSPWWLQPFELIKSSKLTRLPFKEKFDLVLNASLDSNLKAIFAVPSWILTLFQKALRQTGKESISEIWPNLKLLVCGGVKLSNYRPYLEKLAAGLDLDFIETYGASEGYFAFSDDLEKKDLKLIYDNAIFFEFIADPLQEMESLSIQETVPLWKVETGVPYAMLVTTNSGLWRYAINDVIEFTSTNPPRIKVKGRLTDMLDEFGEALYAYEAEQVLNEVIHQTGFKNGNFTVGGVLESEIEVPCHFWFIQFFEPVHKETLDRMAQKIDLELQKINRHYAIRRESGALGAPVVKSINQTEINNWLEFKGKEKAQGKLPNILNSKSDIDFFLKR